MPEPAAYQPASRAPCRVIYRLMTSGEFDADDFSLGVPPICAALYRARLCTGPIEGIRDDDPALFYFLHLVPTLADAKVRVALDRAKSCG